MKSRRTAGGGDRAVRARRRRRLEPLADGGQGFGGGLLGRRERQRAAVHQRRVLRPTARERDGRRARDHRRSRGPGHRPVRQRPVHGRVGLQELVTGAGLADRRRRGVQRQPRVRPGRVRRYVLYNIIIINNIVSRYYVIMIGTDPPVPVPRHHTTANTVILY